MGGPGDGHRGAPTAGLRLPRDAPPGQDAADDPDLALRAASARGAGRGRICRGGPAQRFPRAEGFRPRPRPGRRRDGEVAPDSVALRRISPLPRTNTSSSSRRSTRISATSSSGSSNCRGPKGRISRNTGHGSGRAASELHSEGQAREKLLNNLAVACGENGPHQMRDLSDAALSRAEPPRPALRHDVSRRQLFATEGSSTASSSTPWGTRARWSASTRGGGLSSRTCRSA